MTYKIIGILTGVNIEYDYEEPDKSIITQFIIGLLYIVLLHSSPWQATIGKKLLGIYVIDDNGNRISKMRAIGRYFATILSTISFLIGFIMAGFRKDKRALNDLIASTYVVYGTPQKK